MATLFLTMRACSFNYTAMRTFDEVGIVPHSLGGTAADASAPYGRWSFSCEFGCVGRAPAHSYQVLLRIFGRLPKLATEFRPRSRRGGGAPRVGVGPSLGKRPKFLNQIRYEKTGARGVCPNSYRRAHQGLRAGRGQRQPMGIFGRVWASVPRFRRCLAGFIKELRTLAPTRTKMSIGARQRSLVRRC